MALNKQKFKDSADKIFNKAEQGGLTISCDFDVAGQYDVITNTQLPATSETITTCIREEFKAHEVDGDNVKRDDFKLLVRFVSFATVNPKASGALVTVSGVKCSIMNTELDAADAVYTIHCRQG